MTKITDPKMLFIAYRSDFRAFFEKVFQELHHGRELDPGWHIEAMLHVAEELARGGRTRQAVALPPRMLKSLIFSVAFVAWVLGRSPELQIICASYSLELAERNQRLFSHIIESAWFKKTFPKFKISPKQNNVSAIETTLGGSRRVISGNSSATGFGADYIIVDDPLPADEARNANARRRSIEWYDEMLEGRLNSQERGGIVIVMQRLHPDDLIGHVRRKQELWHYLKLSALAEQDEEVEIGVAEVHYRKSGDLLCPGRLSYDYLMRKKAENLFLFFNQYQQEPYLPEGALIKRAWLKWYEVAPAREFFVAIYQSWDTASSVSANADFSVCITFGVTENGDIYVLDVFRGRLAYPDLLRQVYAQIAKYRPTAVLVEKGGIGIGLISDYYARGGRGMIGIDPREDKKTRLEHQSSKMEAGRLFLPAKATWLADFVQEITAFPGGRHDDQVDALSQFLKWDDTRRRKLPEVHFYPICNQRRLFDQSPRGPYLGL